MKRRSSNSKQLSDTTLTARHARAKPADQRALRRMLREMAEAGKIDRREGRRVATPDQLPEVTVLNCLI